jgi:hypothetical protein
MAITREKSTGGCYSGDHFQKRRERGRRLQEEGDDTGERVGVPVRGRGDAGPRLASGVGPNGFPGSVYIFFSPLLLFLFCFLISFTDFAKRLQNKLNHFQRILQNLLQGFESVGKQGF